MEVTSRQRPGLSLAWFTEQRKITSRRQDLACVCFFVSLLLCPAGSLSQSSSGRANGQTAEANRSPLEPRVIENNLPPRLRRGHSAGTKHLQHVRACALVFECVRGTAGVGAAPGKLVPQTRRLSRRVSQTADHMRIIFPGDA